MNQTVLLSALLLVVFAASGQAIPGGNVLVSPDAQQRTQMRGLPCHLGDSVCMTSNPEVISSPVVISIDKRACVYKYRVNSRVVANRTS
jgi:hypothetical protein